MAYAQKSKDKEVIIRHIMADADMNKSEAVKAYDKLSQKKRRKILQKVN